MTEKIKGISVVIGGETKELNDALKKVNKESQSLEKELRDVEKLLKFDPKNPELLAQKQELLTKSIEKTRDKLNALKQAQDQVNRAHAANADWEKQYIPLQKQIDETGTKMDRLRAKEQEMKAKLESGQISAEKYQKYRDELDKTKQEHDNLKKAAKDLEKQFADGHISDEQYRQVQREIEETEQKLKSLETQAKESKSALANISSGADKVAGAAGKVGNAMLPVTAAVGGIGAVAIKAGSDFDTAMSQVIALSGATSDEVTALRDKAKQMGETTKFSATESANAFSYMALAGWKTEDMLNGIDGIMALAAASGEDLASVSDIVTDALTAFGLSANDSAHFSDVLAQASANSNTTVALMGNTFQYVAPVAGALGYTVEDTAVAIGLMANAGIKGEKAGTALRTMMTNLAKPTDAVRGYMSDLGISMTNTYGTMRPLNDLLVDMRDKMSGLTEAQQAEYAAGIAGKEAMSGLLAIVNAAPEDFEKLSAAINNSDGASQKMADTMIDNLGGDATLLKSQLEGLAISVSEGLMPTIRRLVEKVSEWVGKFAGLDEKTQKLILTIVGIIAAIGPAAKVVQGVSLAVKGLSSVMTFLLAHPVIMIIAAVVAAIAGLVAGFKYLWDHCEGFRNFWIGLWDGIKSIVSTVVGWFQKIFTETIPNAWNTVVSFFQKIPEWWAGIWQSVKDFFANIWNAILNNPVIQTIVNTITSLWSTGKETLTGIWDGIKTAATGAWELIKNIILAPVLFVIDLVTGNFTKLSEDAQKIWNNIKDAASEIWNGIKQAVTSFATGLRDGVQTAFEGLKNFASNIWSTISNAVSNAWNSIKSFAVNTAHSMVDGIKNALLRVGTAVREGFQDAIDWITQLPSRALQWGKDMIDGMINGIKSKISGIKDAVSGVGDKIREFLHFSRPDAGPLREYEKWMPDFMDGLARGINKSKSKVVDAIRGLTSEMQLSYQGVDAIGKIEYSAEIKRERRAAAAQNGGLTYNQTVNNYSPKALSPAESARQTRNATRQMINKLVKA